MTVKANSRGDFGACGGPAFGREPARPLPQARFVALDTETTGLDLRRDLPVSMAAVPFEEGHPRPERAYTSLVNPGRPIPRAARRIHGISDHRVKEAPPPPQALGRLLAWWPAGCPLVGFQVSFDLALLSRIARESGLRSLDAPALDVAHLARALWPQWGPLTLDELAGRLRVPVEGRHTAQGDAITAGRIYLKLVPLLLASGVDTLDAALRLQAEAANAPAAGLWPGGSWAAFGGP